jgi:hypothetical protein
MQTWDYGDMTFVPYFNLLEFLPRGEYSKWSQDGNYHPRSLLLDEVVPGEKYVLVVTNFHGGAFVRYMLSDVIEVTSLHNSKLNINLPQMVFYSRADNILDFGGASLTEKAIWQAIENSGVDYVDWVARKEERVGPILHLYIEQKGDRLSEKELTRAIDGQLRAIKEDYDSMVGEQGFKLLEVSSLPNGTFQTYITRQQQTGVDPAWWKPPHINPSDKVLTALLKPETREAARV